MYLYQETPPIQRATWYHRRPVLWYDKKGKIKGSEHNRSKERQEFHALHSKESDMAIREKVRKEWDGYWFYLFWDPSIPLSLTASGRKGSQRSHMHHLALWMRVYDPVQPMSISFLQKKSVQHFLQNRINGTRPKIRQNLQMHNQRMSKGRFPGLFLL